MTMLAETRPDPWIIRPRPNPRARLRLFCLPYAGGGASTYRGWPAYLPADIEVVAVQFPGREERLIEPAFSHASDLCLQLAAVLAPYLDRPFALFGHCMGGLVAFELTRLLRTIGAPSPVHLFISGHCGPQKVYCFPPMAGMSDAELVALIRRLGGTPDEVLADGDVMPLLLPLLRCDLTICESYRYVPAEPLACPISVFGGILDKVVRRTDLLAWGAETRGGFQARMFPGGHFFFDDMKPRLLQAITDDLAVHHAPAVASTAMYDGGSPHDHLAQDPRGIAAHAR
jgi:medium-chain acyl-[acyl-carrier-protein] hydrolase